MIVGAVAALNNVESRVEDLISQDELLNIKTPEDVHNKIVEMMQNDNENTEFLTSRRDALIQELNEIDDALSAADTKAAAKPAATAATATKTAAAATKTAAAATSTFTKATAEASIKVCDLLKGDLKKTCYDGLKKTAEAQVKASPKDTNVKAYSDAIESAYATAYGGSSLWIWIVVAILVVAAGVGVFFFLKKKGDGNEGGESDGYTKFIDQELA